MDKITKKQRSRNMAAIKTKNTKPEITVRKLLHRNGLRFRLHQRKLPGKPDIVLKKHKTAIFVNGCFWHHHKNCRRANIPKTNTEYWIPKINRNTERDRKAIKELKKMGWDTLVIWECEVKDRKKMIKKLNNKLGLKI